MKENLKRRVFFLFLTSAVVLILGTITFFYAQGYKLDLKNLRISTSGILAVKSNPDGAQVFVNGELKIITNNSLRISPGTYDISIKKEGYQTWEKRITIEKEVVTEINAQLVRVAPSLSPLTFLGASSPTISYDLSKIAFLVPYDKNQPGKEGVYIIETVNLPLGFSHSPRRITDGNPSDGSWFWSPDGKEILLVSKEGAFLIDTGTFTPQEKRINIESKKDQILKTWGEERKKAKEAKIKNLPEEIKDILINKSYEYLLSPDETKVLYIASASATLPENLIKPLPGASTQKQERNIKEYQTYVYDIKEDRNFLIDSNSEDLTTEIFKPHKKNRVIFWFPTSRELVLAEKEKIMFMDYDGTNRKTIFSGNYISPFALPSQSSDKIFILTNLGAESQPPNLYSLNLK